MALIKVCDKCMKPFSDSDDEITVEVMFKKDANSILKSHKKLHLHNKCFREIFNSNDYLETLKETEI